MITCEACGNRKQATENGLMPWHVDIVKASRQVFAWCHNYDPITEPDFIVGEVRECEGCTAESGEPCREWCLSTVTTDSP